MPIDDGELNKIANRWGGSTDASYGIGATARWFRDALASARGGQAALEIGVRSGGTSATICEIATRSTEPGFMVLSVDPYGSMPYSSPNNPHPYGEDFYKDARTALLEFPNSVLFRMTDEEFLHRVLPTYHWWWETRRLPTSERFLAFTFLDGPHENTAVVDEFCAVARHTAPGGLVVVDNTEHVPEAVEMIAKSPRLGVVLRERWVSPVGSLRRAVFEVPV